MKSSRFNEEKKVRILQELRKVGVKNIIVNASTAH